MSVEARPDPETIGLVYWRLRDVRYQVLDWFEAPYTLESVRRFLRAAGVRNFSPRPVHPKAISECQEAFRRNRRATVRDGLTEGVPLRDVEFWLQDGLRAGRKGMLSRVWAIRAASPYSA